MDETHAEAETLLVEPQRATENSSSRQRSRVAVGLLVGAGCLAAVALHSGAWGAAFRQPATSQSGLVELSEVGSQKGAKSSAEHPDHFKEKCGELKTHIAKAKEGHKPSIEHLKRHGLSVKDFEDTFEEDPCDIDSEASEKMVEILKEMAEMEKSEKSSGKNLRNGSISHTAHKVDRTTTLLPAKKEHKCSGQGEDCRTSRCCSQPGMQCYTKSQDWAQCQETCTPGKDPSDVDSMPWNCTELGKRTTGEAQPCSEEGESCMESKCCNAVGHACYTKNDTFATCKPSCVPGPDYSDEDDWKPWRCKQLGNPKPGKGPWVDDECADDTSDCREASCCKTSGFQCYEMGTGWAQCKPDCSTERVNEWEEPWTCKEIGRRTPPSGYEAQLRPRGDPPKVARWVKEHCTKGDNSCKSTHCCQEPGMQCYTKDHSHAKCMDRCDPGDNTTKGWQCKELGSRSFGVARKTWPSLFCFAVFRVCHPKEDCYEQGLLERIHELGPDSAGIFGCDDWGTASNEAATIGGRKSWVIGNNFEVGISKDGTAANTELFMRVWDLVIEDGRFRLHDWTVKVDPDAVLCPWKLTHHLGPHTNDGDHGGRLYVVNCNAWPDSESFPMMYGSVEILSRGAVLAYADNRQHCSDILPWEDWGEDFYITRCLDQIDVGRLEMFNVVGDNVCVGPGQGGTGDCSEGDRAAFHPFKTIESWTECYNNAVGYHPNPPPEEASQDPDQPQRLKLLKL